MTRTLPCCGCACSATRLFGCHPSRCSPPLFHSHVRVNSTLGVRTACLASRVACVRAWSWLSHPRPPDRSQHGCTVGVLPGPTRVLPMPRQYGIGRRAPTRAVLVGVLWCAYTVCGICRQYVLYCVLSRYCFATFCYFYFGGLFREGCTKVASRFLFLSSGCWSVFIFPAGWSECCLSVFFFAGVWEFGIPYRRFFCLISRPSLFLGFCFLFFFVCLFSCPHGCLFWCPSFFCVFISFCLCA